MRGINARRTQAIPCSCGLAPLVGGDATRTSGAPCQAIAICFLDSADCIAEIHVIAKRGPV